jgi:hypothetical protein
MGKAHHAAPTPTRHTVYTHDIIDNYNDSVIEAFDGECNIDIGINTIQANATNQHPPGSRMPFTRWKGLPPETLAIWATIPEKDKATILGTGKSTLGSSSRNMRPARAQSHHLSDADRIAAYLHKLGIDETPQETPGDEVPVEDIPPDTDDSGTTLLARSCHQTHMD